MARAAEGRRAAAVGGSEADRRVLHPLADGIPLVLIALLGFALAWLGRSPWWGWALVAALLVAIGATARWWARGPVLVRIGAWLVAGA
ncbi:hypothetical protein, partial [Microbacterium sp.]|uniref:hypothetical protein n=1 Tax=Microbacterium sp. TaxID=51671 RepID=UPI003C71A8CC